MPIRRAERKMIGQYNSDMVVSHMDMELSVAEAPGRWADGTSALWQVVGVCAAWLWIVFLHWHNDGLWFTGDAARHAANGLFWWDFLAHLPSDPFQFALGWYARYPVINPTVYPPVFYLIEGATFSALGASPFVAKGLVLSFALMTALYLVAWLRRWVGKEAGWGGMLLMLQPAIILWSNAILLNVPSMAMAVAALYHTRRWLEAPSSRQIYLAAIFATLGVLLYLPSAIIVFIMAAWTLWERQWKALGTRRVWIVVALSVIVLLPWALIAVRYAPVHVSFILPGRSHTSLLAPSRWMFYLWQFPNMIGWPLLSLSVVGIVGVFGRDRLRREVSLLTIWVIVGYAVLSYLTAKEQRYALLLLPPLIVLGTIGLLEMARWTAAWFNHRPSRFVLGGVVALLGWLAWNVPHVPVPVVDGFQAVARFFEAEAPNDTILYDGDYNGVFSFYLLSGDPRFSRGVVRGDKLLWEQEKETETQGSRIGTLPPVAELIDLLRKKCGCRWLALEGTDGSMEPGGSRELRQVVSSGHAQFVRSFPILSPQVSRVDIYRLEGPIEGSGERTLPLPLLGEGTQFRAKPIDR